MTKVIIREQLDVAARIQHLDLGAGAKVVHCAESRDGRGMLDIWAEVGIDKLLKDPARVPVYTSFYVAATGDPTDDNMRWLSTVVMKSGLVWHIHQLV